MNIPMIIIHIKLCMHRLISADYQQDKYQKCAYTPTHMHTNFWQKKTHRFLFSTLNSTVPTTYNLSWWLLHAPWLWSVSRLFANSI